jgi:hypothetical protein
MFSGVCGVIKSRRLDSASKIVLFGSFGRRRTSVIRHRATASRRTCPNRQFRRES